MQAPKLIEPVPRQRKRVKMLKQRHLAANGGDLEMREGRGKGGVTGRCDRSMRRACPLWRLRLVKVLCQAHGMKEGRRAEFGYMDTV
jgi:hypothetical protein